MNLFRTVAIAAALAATPLLANQKPWDAAKFAGTPAEVIAAAAVVPSNEAEVVILLDESTYQLTDDSSATNVERVVYRLVEDSAVDDWGTVSTVWAPWYEERPTIEARVITREGTEHRLDQAAISESPAPEDSLDIFSDNRIIRAPLPAVAAGSVVERVITRKLRSPIPTAGLVDSMRFGSWVPVLNARLLITAPEAVAISMVNRTSPELKTVKSVENGVQTIRVESGPIDAITSFEWNLPYDVSNVPYISFSTGRSWQNFAQRYHEIVEKQIAGNFAADLAKKAAAGKKSRTEKIESVLEWIQKNIRYAGVELGEGSIVPRPPETVYQNRYGDCKDKASLVVAMLRALGVPANVVLLRAGDDLDIDPNLPGMGVFNHAIVRVQGEPAIWIDPTDEFARAGQLPAMDQGRLALVIDPSTTGLVRTPESDATGNRFIETRTFRLSEEGKGTVTEISEVHGTGESAMRRFYATSEAKAYRGRMEEYVRGYYGAKELKSLTAGDPRDLAKPFRITVEADEVTRAQTNGGEAAVAIVTSTIMSDLPWQMRTWIDVEKMSDADRKKHRPRRNDFVFQPFIREWRYRIVPPPGFEPRKLPAPETLTFGTTKLEMKYSLDSDGVVTADYRFDAGKRRLTPSELETTQKAIADYQKREPVIVSFESVGYTKLSEGDVAAALAEFRRLGALHPKEARHEVDVARALLVGGMGAAAREQIEKAIALEPGYAQGHRMRGLILQHDLLGRRWRTGFDRNGAIASFRKARELDPKDVDIRMELAQSLEVGTDGVRYGKGADLDGAIAEYRSVVDELKEESAEGELVMALARAQRFQELRDLTPKLADAKRRNAVKVITAAALDGTAAALREASALDTAERNSALNAAGGLLVAVRRYAVAADLMEAAMQSSPSTELRSRVETMRKAKRFEDMQLPENDPKTVVTRLAYKLLVDEIDAKSIAEYFTTDVREVLAKSAEERNPWEGARTAMLSVARDQALPLEFYADLGLASMQLTMDGDDKTGYRVRTRSGSGTSDDETFYVVKENGRYLVSASTNAPALIGWSVLRMVDAGQMDAARQWLNWAREEFKAGSADDPLSGLPFPRLWSRGKPSATREEIETAAAAMMLSKEMAPRAQPILDAARERLSGEQKQSVELALALMNVSLENGEALLPLASDLYKNNPESVGAFELVTSAYSRLGKYADLEAAAKERLARMPKDHDAMQALGEAAMLRSDYKTAATRYEEVLDGFQPNSNDFNAAAWNALFVGGDLTKAIDWARRSVELSRNGSAQMHTLATLYAESGKSLEAREALLASMDAAGREEPAPHDWYVLGRIAENYGATDAAREAYEKVEKPKVAEASDTWVLATRRLKMLSKMKVN